MSFGYRSGSLYCQEMDIHELAKQIETPFYLYSEDILRRNASVLREIFSSRGFHISYAVKANPNPTILKIFKSFGFGLDIVSGGELQLALHSNFTGDDINFAGVGKKREEIDFALENDIAQFDVESGFELRLLQERAERAGKKTSVLLRLNPDIDPLTHPHISTGLKENKFGIEADEVESILRSQENYPNLIFEGLHCHIGSQIQSSQPYLDLIVYLKKFTQDLEQTGVSLKKIDFGGGFGVDYQQPFADILETNPYLEAFAEKAVKELGNYKLLIQPGRVLVGNAAVLVTEVLGLKTNGDRNFLVIDAAMTELNRPVLYNAYHSIFPVKETRMTKVVDVVGPVCESSDTMARRRDLQICNAGDYMVIASVGAYGSAMGSTYNMRPRVAEIMVRSDNEIRTIRRRQSYNEMMALYPDNS